MKKTVMILGASDLQLPLIKRANERGINTVVVSPVLSEPGHRIAKYSEKCNVIDEKGVLEIAKKYKINGIITDQTDLPVRTMAYIAKEIGIPGNDYEVARIFTDKYLMREQCKRIGIKTLQYKLCKNVDEVIGFYENLGKDIIIKPVDNQGSKGVYRIKSKSDIHTKYEEATKYSRSKQILAEEYVVGQEFLVEGICLNYEYRNLCCGDTHYFDIPDVFSAYTREFPSVASQLLVEKVMSTNERIVKGFGLKQGITHGEYILSGDDVILLEIAARGGGVYISSDLIPLQTGICTEDFLLDIALGEAKKIPDIVNKKQSCCYISFFLPKGTITRIEGIKEVQELPYTYNNNLDSLQIGKTIQQAKDKTGRFFIALSAKNHEELMERISFIQNRIQVFMDNSCGSKIIWE